MDYRKVIHDSWTFTKENKPLVIWYAFIPSFLGTIVGIFYLTYQFFAFKQSSLFSDAGNSFIRDVMTFALDFFSEHSSLLIPTIIVATIVIILYLLLPTLFQGGLIQIIARKKRNIPVKTYDGLSMGMLVFLPLFKYHLFIRSFALITMFTEAGFAARNLGTEVMDFLLPIFILFAVIGFMLTLIFTYSEFYIVLENAPMLSAMGRSSKLVVLHWTHTILIAILMAIVSLRVIINVLFVMLVPALIIVSAGLLATVTLTKIGIIVGGVLGFIALIFASYLSGIFHVFASTVWTFTFLNLEEESQKKEFVLHENGTQNFSKNAAAE